MQTSGNRNGVVKNTERIGEDREFSLPEFLSEMSGKAGAHRQNGRLVMNPNFGGIQVYFSAKGVHKVLFVL